MTHECIAAFLDNEPFDVEELRRSLATDEGRAFLIDSLALRDLVQPDDAAIVVGISHRRPMRWLAVASAVALCSLSGYWMGQRQATGDAPMAAVVPDGPQAPVPVPSRVIRLEPGVTWHETGGN
jgi:hypothetical protein